MFKRLTEFWNDEKGAYTKKEDVAEFVANSVKESFTRQFLTEKVDEKYTLRLSQLGKPLILLCLYKLGYTEPNSTSFKQDWIFSLGDVVETYLMSLVHMCGYDLHSAQEEVVFEGVKGHIDFAVGETIVEVKSMSDTYFRQFIKDQDDARGYLTQLHTYCAAAGTKRGVWLLLNKGTNELVEIPLRWSDSTISRAKTVIYNWQQCESIDWLLEHVSPPEGTPEFKAGVLTGRFLVPAGMRYSHYADAFYDIYGQYMTSYKPNWYKSFE